MTALAPAPLHSDVARGPAGGRAHWLTTSDGVRIRLGLWAAPDARGTVIVFPGRTEYIEKYGLLAHDIQAAGYSVAAVDWRGQGLADRALVPRDIGHVGDFAEYQLDVRAVSGALSELNLPQPWYLIAHSMGGLIGLRALHERLEVARAVFSAPMWGISLSWPRRVAAPFLKFIARPLGLENRFAPTTGPWTPSAFDGNPLTTDREQFDYMEHQVAQYPDLALGGPSTRWMIAALAEATALMNRPPPAMPVLTFLGTAEWIVSQRAIRRRMANWPGSHLEILDGARHEVLMEAPHLRSPVLEKTLAWFDNR